MIIFLLDSPRRDKCLSPNNNAKEVMLMKKFGDKVTELFSGLYSDSIVEEAGRLSQYYMEKQDVYPLRMPVPDSMHDVTDHRDMIDSCVEAPKDKLKTGFFKMIGAEDGKKIIGPFNHILARMFTIPRMIDGYIENYPTDTEELAIYTDPNLLQYSPDELKELRDIYFAQASDILKDPAELIERFRLLGEIGEDAAQIESAYPAVGSTQAYELFGIFHLFPSNKTVDVTSTSPGVILPTEADPLKYKDSVDILKKNLLRPTYFEMLRHAIDLDPERKRRYSANRKGTAKNLQAYPQLLEAAKDILRGYIDLGKSFEIRLGEQDPRMRKATLVGDIGVVYSVRDKEQKSKIAHNVTIIDPKEADRHRKTFEEQYNSGETIKDVKILDGLMKEAL